MKTIKYFVAILVLGLAFAGCKKEAVIEPSAIAIQFQLPQGNHDYDATLVDLNKKYGSFFLYKFSVVDFGATPVYSSSNFGDTYSVDLADENYVGKALAFVQKNWLQYYSDDFLKANLPFKVLLGQNLRRTTSPTTTYTVLSSYNQMTLSYFSAAFDALTAAQKKTYVNNLHVEFFNFISNRGKLDIPADFLTVSNYAQTGVTTTNMYTYGFLIAISSLDNKPTRDFLSYITAITGKTKAELDASILLPSNDTNGLVKKKYDIIINYYKQKYNIDLQAIGNAGVVN